MAVGPYVVTSCTLDTYSTCEYSIQKASRALFHGGGAGGKGKTEPWVVMMMMMSGRPEDSIPCMCLPYA